MLAERYHVFPIGPSQNLENTAATAPHETRVIYFFHTEKLMPHLRPHASKGTRVCHIILLGARLNCSSHATCAIRRRNATTAHSLATLILLHLENTKQDRTISMQQIIRPCHISLSSNRSDLCLLFVYARQTLDGGHCCKKVEFHFCDLLLN